MTVLAVIERQYQGLKWLIFLTNWSYTFINLHFVTQAFLVYYYQTVQPNSYGSDSNGSNSNGSNINGMNIKGSNKEFEEESESDDNSDDEQFIFSVEPQLPLACKVSWIICDIASNIAFPVTVMFWSLVYKPGDFDFVTLNSHALNSVLIVIDIMVSSIPIKLLHVIYPIIFITVYMIFSIIYWACGGTNPYGEPYIYPALDYSGHPKRAAIIICLFLFVGNAMSQLLLFGLYELRLKLNRSWNRLIWTVNRKKEPELELDISP